MHYLKNVLKFFLFIVLLFGLTLFALYTYHNKELPQGKQGPAADRLAEKMLDALNHDAYEKLNYIEWTFSSRGRGRHFKWQKTQGLCSVEWDSVSVNLNLNALNKSSVLVNQRSYNGELKKKYISDAEAKFNNDSFWLVAPYKLFDKGVERRLVQQESGENALLVTYKSGGTTPGDSYLWLLDRTYKPKAFQMWVSIIPIGGLEASWEKWVENTSGAFFPQQHQLLFLDLDITGLDVH